MSRYVFYLGERKSYTNSIPDDKKSNLCGKYLMVIFMYIS